MRALILHGPGDLRLEEVADPHPGSGEAVLETQVAMTCATDAKMLRQGRHPALPDPPTGLGHELVGVVREVGAGVARDLLGRRVVAANSAPCGACWACEAGLEHLCADRAYLTGAFAERVRVPAAVVARNLLPVPEDLPDELAAMVEPLACAVRGAERCSAREGDPVLVLGAGTQGLLLTSRLAARGCPVTVCDPHPERRERALRFGAVAVAEAPRDARAVAALRAGTPGGAGASHVVEAVGRIEAWETAIRLARPGGEVTLYGGCPPGSELTVPAADLHYGELRIQGCYHHSPASVRAALAALAAGAAPYGELVGEAIGLEDVAGVLEAGGRKHPVRPAAGGGASAA